MTHFSELWQIIKSSKKTAQEYVIKKLTSYQTPGSRASDYCTGKSKIPDASADKILEFYDENKLVDKVNDVFSKGFTYAQIDKCINLLENWNPTARISEQAYNYK